MFKMLLSNCPGKFYVKKSILTSLIFQSYFFQEIVHDLVRLPLPQGMLIESNCVPVGVGVCVCARVLLCSLSFLFMCLFTSTVRVLYVVHLVYMSLSSFPSSSLLLICI